MSKTVVQIGPYKLGKTLGVGSFSKVKKATHEPTERKVAIKILNRGQLDRMDMGDKVRREIDILRLFNHPHIIRLYEVIDTPTDIFVVMEYVSGGELFDYIVSHGRLEEHEARRFFQQIISGVEYCHTHMVVHRDLKPENLLLDNQNNVRIADFGLSNIMRDGFFLKTSCGSPNYAAPEVISGNLYAGPEVDVWSCGVILYALLCGSLPFDDENIPNLFRKIKGGVYNMPSYLSHHTQDLIPRMLAVDPIKRITIADIRQHPWFQQNLSPYLSLSATETIKQTEKIDQDILQQVVNIGFKKEDVLQALELGPDLLTRSSRVGQLLDRFDHTEIQIFKQMAVAYNLLLDKKDKVTDTPTMSASKPVDINQSSTPSSRIFGFSNTSPFSTNISPSSKPGLLTPNSLTLTPSSFEDHTLFDKFSIRTPHMYSSASLSMTPTQWFLGFWTSCQATEMMKRIFKALEECEFEWKMISPYKIKARHIPSVHDFKLSVVTPSVDSSSDTKHEYASNEANRPRPDSEDHTGFKIVKIGIQLYSVSRQHHSTLGGGRKRYRYVVDIQKLVGEMFPFMDLCAKLVQNLQGKERKKGRQKVGEVILTK